VKTSQLVDDLDGSIDDVESRYFGLDGRHYEIDLTKENWELLLAELEPFVKKGREISTRKIRPRKSPVRARTAEENLVIRNWARENGFPQLGTRGRVPSAATKAYEAAHSEESDLTESA
jgi:hypothetical protein